MGVYLPRSEQPAPELEVFGFCDNCKQWLPLGCHSWLPIHTHADKKCSGSEYSPSGEKLLIKNKEEAKKVSLFLMEDKGWCLTPGYFGSRLHSARCGDGRTCEQTRRMIASALATYYLETVEANRPE